VKLAEALAIRSDLSKRLEQLRSRAQATARHQEDERPAEDAGALLAEADRVLTELEDLYRRINRTNAGTVVDGEMTLTDALAKRDVLRLRHSLYTSVADAASGRRGPEYVRQMRSELRNVAAVPVSELRATADRLAQQHRELDIQIQRVNWEADLTG
jgi:hypothetical protein